MPQFSSSELELLLASDSIKYWSLTDKKVNGTTVIQDCELDNLLSLTRSLTTTDTSRVVFTSGETPCPDQPDSIIFTGSWSLVDSANTQFLSLIVEEDSSVMTIDFISSQLLQLSGNRKGDQVQEDYIHYHTPE